MQRLKKILCIVLKTLNTARIFILNFLFVVLLIAVAVIFLFKPAQVELDKPSILVLNPQGYLVEQETFVPLLEQLRGNTFSGSDRLEVSVYDLLAAIDHAIYDERILGIVLDLRYFWGGGLSKLQQVGEKLALYREQTGNPVYAYGEYYSQSQYYLAAYASELVLDPAGSIDLRGFYAYQSYVSELLSKLQIDAHIFRAGDFKSATEPYQRTDMSPQAREATSSWLNALWQNYLTDIQQHRILDPRVTSGLLVDHLGLREENGFDQSSYALHSGLANQLLSRHEFEQMLKEQLFDKADQLPTIAFQPYLTLRKEEIGQPTHSHPIIEVVTISGAIYYGSGNGENAASETVIRDLQRALEDERVKAILLRIDSPGGSAFASELIRREVVRIREAGKPVVVSMSSVAASGGYWVALGAEKIYASESTLTGSIGVFGMVFTLPEALAEIGVYTDGVATSEIPIIDSFQSLPDSAKHILQLDVEKTYQDFISRVRDSRQLTQEQALTAANGRVWTGAQALELGLIDALGDISLATQAAAELANLEQYVVRRTKREQSPLQTWLTSISSHVSLTPSVAPKEQLAPLSLQRILTEVEELTFYNDPRHVYARCLACLEY